MRRGAILWLWLGLLAGCRPYDGYSPLLNESGLISAAQFARYGAEQAQAMAIARSLGQWYEGESRAARTNQATKAAEYARTLPGVVRVVPDSVGYRLTVTFQSGWRVAIVPVNDGVLPEDTPGLPAAK
jgi:hypothetical protein